MKQLKTEIIALCDYALIAKDNKLSIMGIFDEFRVKKFPSGFIDKFLVATLHGEPSTPYRLTVDLEKENVNKNLLNPTIVNVQTSPNGKHNVIIRLTNVGFDKEGNYLFKILHGNDLVGLTHLKVIDLQKVDEESAVRTIN